jgi:predicted MFS family arabinose efflux permease
VVEMVDQRDDLSNAIALNSSMVNMARLIGPSIAGIVIAAVGEAYCFLIDGFSYIAVIASLLLMSIRVARRERARSSMIAELREGWDYVAHFAPVRSILLLLALVSLVGMPYTVLMPIFAAQVLHGGAHTLGFLMGASGVGALYGAARLAARKTVLGLGRLVPLMAAVFGGSLIAFSLSRWLYLSLPLMFLTGLGMMQQMACSNTILQTIVPDERRGRVMSYYTMAFFGMAPFGSLLAGSLASRIGAPRTLMVGGVCCVIAAAWFWRELPNIRHLVRPIYVNLGILPEVATGLQSAAEMRENQ